MTLPNEHHLPGDAGKPADQRSPPGASNSPPRPVTPVGKAPVSTIRITAGRLMPSAPIKPHDACALARDAAGRHQNPDPDGNDNVYLPPEINE